MWFYGDTETYNRESLEMTSTICGETLEDTSVVRAQQRRECKQIELKGKIERGREEQSRVMNRRVQKRKESRAEKKHRVSPSLPALRVSSLIHGQVTIP